MQEGEDYAMDANTWRAEAGEQVNYHQSSVNNIWRELSNKVKDADFFQESETGAFDANPSREETGREESKLDRALRLLLQPLEERR